MPEQIPEMQPVTSSHVAAVGYDESAQALYVQWKNGKVSMYDNVPPLIASDLQHAHSVGAAFNETIKGKYQHRYVEQ